MYRNRNKRTLKPIDENVSAKHVRTTIEDADSSSFATVHRVEVTIEQHNSEENIPASQEHTQRFLSQRSVLAATLGRTQSSTRINASQQINTYFELVLTKAGIHIDDGDTFVINCDHISIVAKLRDIIMKAPNYPDNLETFQKGLKTALSPRSKLIQKLLTGCTIHMLGDETIFQSQHSMFVNFLMIDCLREPCLQILLDKIEEVAASRTVIMSQNNFPLLPLMLSQLRVVTFSHSEKLFERIKDIFEKANESAKMDIISSAEILLNSSKHDDFAELLLRHYASSQELFTIANSQTLSNLMLSDGVLGKLRARILDFIQSGQSQSRTLPHLIRILLNVLNQENDYEIRDLVNTLREIFNCQIKFEDGQTILSKQSQLELFGFLEQGLMRSKKFYQMWQKTIAGLPSNGFKSIDFMILLLLIHIKEENMLYIENILRRRIKLEHITINILGDIISNYAHILEQHIETLMYILYDFVRERTAIVAEFAKSAYSILFKIGGSIQRDIIKKLLQLSCDRSTKNLITISLQILRNLQRKYPKDIHNWAMLLLPLLDRLNDMTLVQTRIVMELICHVAIPPPNLPECPALQDQIDMVIKKQLINRLDFVKKQGIIGSVQLIDALARVREPNNDDEEDAEAAADTTIDTIENFPDGRGKQAANLITLTRSAIAHCPESIALFYDELASVFEAHERSAYRLDVNFVVWLSELISLHLQTNFITVNEGEEINIKGIKLEFKKCINQFEDISEINSEEGVQNIGINISSLVLDANADAQSSILLLAPLFNFVRVLTAIRYKDSLEAVNALLGSAIVLPSFFDDSNYLAIFDSYDCEDQKRILDIYYHTINWMRVTICAFISQKDSTTHHRVLERLTDLIKIEHQVKSLLTHAPVDFVPPPNQFLFPTPTQPVKGGGGREKTQSSRGRGNVSRTNEITITDSPALNDTAVQVQLGETTVKLAACKLSKAKINFQQLYGPRECYRQLGPDIVMLLQDEFRLTYPLDPDEDSSEQLGLLELRFILTDLVDKLEGVVNPQVDASESLLQHIARPSHFMNDLTLLLPHIHKYFEALAKIIIDKLDAVEHLYSNLDLFTNCFNYIKVCFGLCLKILRLYFSWSEWSESSHETLLQSSLFIFLPQDQCHVLRKKRSSYTASKVFDYFLSFEKSVILLSSAVELQQLLRSLRKLSNTGEDVAERSKKQAQCIQKLCGMFLNRKWYQYNGSVEKGAQCNTFLDKLVKGYLKDLSYLRQKEILSIVCEECQMLNTKDKSLNTFPNIQKANFSILFRGLCEILISTLSAQVGADNADDGFLVWQKTIVLLSGLLDIVKKVEHPRNFVLFLKHSQSFLKLLLQHGLPLMETTLRGNPEEVGTFLRNLQDVTRFLHQLCCHSKSIRDTAIISYIPSLRETVEVLLFRVKALLAANKCNAVFQMGNLINKDIHGEKIVTPCVSMLSTDGSNSDEEIPDDDASVDETILGGGMRATSPAPTTTTTSSLDDDDLPGPSDKSRSECY